MIQVVDGIAFHTKWWFDEKNRKLWDKYLVRAMPPPIVSYLEIGVGEGHSMRWVLEHLQPKHAVGIDPYVVKRRSEKEQIATHKANAKLNLADWLQSGVVALDTRSSWEYLIEANSHNNLEPDTEQFDLVYVDGDHRCLRCATDCILAWPLVRVGGIMIMDDFDRRYQRGWPMSREGITAFLNAAEKTYDIVWGEPYRRDVAHVAIRKTDEMQL
jgi:hypothetical protein